MKNPKKNPGGKTYYWCTRHGKWSLNSGHTTGQPLATDSVYQLAEKMTTTVSRRNATRIRERGSHVIRLAAALAHTPGEDSNNESEASELSPWSLLGLFLQGLRSFKIVCHFILYLLLASHFFQRLAAWAHKRFVSSVFSAANWLGDTILSTLHQPWTSRQRCSISRRPRFHHRHRVGKLLFFLPTLPCAGVHAHRTARCGHFDTKQLNQNPHQQLCVCQHHQRSLRLHDPTNPGKPGYPWYRRRHPHRSDLSDYHQMDNQGR